jgi:hypothetical protein
MRVRPLFIYNGEIDKARILDLGYQRAKSSYKAAYEALMSCQRIYWKIDDFYSYYP